MGIGLMCLLVAVVILLFKPYDYGAGVTRFRKIRTAVDEPGDSRGAAWRFAKIRPGLNACHDVAKLKDRVFLSGEMPGLPLASCNESDCRCHYIYLADRRSGIDRRDGLARPGEYLASSERDRRRLAGRRIEDLMPGISLLPSLSSPCAIYFDRCKQKSRLTCMLHE